jgi:hypothetical protein
MELMEVTGTAQISFNGVTHTIDNCGNTFCGTKTPMGRLFNDQFNGVHVDQITCKRCLNKINKEGNPHGRTKV